MIVSVHQPQYLPWLGYFHKIAKSDCFVFLDKVQYKHREYQNRNKIRAKDGPIWLTVPVITKGKGRQSINEILIDNSVDWKKSHLRSLETCYGKAKFFKDHIDFFNDTYSRQWQRLSEINIHITRYILKKLEITTPIYMESEIGTTQASTERIIEICKKIKADVYLSGQGGRDYLDEQRFSQEGLKLEYQEFIHPVYGQCFSKGDTDFVSHLAAVDLLFNEGPRTRDILNK